MQNIILGTIGLLVASAGTPQDVPQLDLTPLSGTTLRRTFVAEHELTLEGFRQRIDEGESRDLPGGARFTSKQRLVFDDLAGPALGQRPLTLWRKFIALESTAALAPPEVKEPVLATAQTELVGASVVMTWAPEEQSYGRYYDAREEAESLLASLSVDPWMGWIVGKGKAEDGSWKIPAKDLEGLLAPGGDLGFTPGTERAGRRLSRTLVNGVGGGLEMAFGGQSTGELTVRPLGLQTNEEGARHLVFSLSLNGRWNADVTERLSQTLLPREREQGSSFERASLSLGLNGRGQMLADPITGRPVSLKLNCTESVSMKLTEGLETGNLFHQEMSMRGRLEIVHRVAERK